MFFKKYKEPLLIFSFVLIVFIFLFGSVLDAGYIIDDHSVIENRKELRSVSALYKVFTLSWHQNQPWAGNYRPLTLLSYALTLLFSESTAVMRFINIVIHSANAALVFYLVRMFFTGRVAYLTAIGFAVLPINTGTILSLVGRSDLLSSLFMLLSVILFYRNKYFWSVLSFFFALLAKDFSVFLLPVILLLSLCSKRRKLKEILKTAFYYSLALGSYLILRYLSLGDYAFQSRGSVDPIIGPLAFADFKERILTGFVYFYFYLRKTFIPFDLSPDYSFNQIPVPSFLNHELAVGLILLIAILFVFFKASGLEIKMSIILFLAPFGVISNTVFVTTGVFAQRWWYFPSIGLLLFFTALLDKLRYHKTFNSLIAVFLLAAAVFYSFVSFKEGRIWTNEKKLIVSAAENSPNSVWARTNLAAVYFKEKKFDLAEREIEQSLKISEDHPAALNVYAKLKWRKGEFGEAKSAFERAVEYDLNRRNGRDLYRSLAILSIETKNYDEALNYIKNAINDTAFGNIEKTVYLDGLLLARIENLAENKPNRMSESEKKTVDAFIFHIRGF